MTQEKQDETKVAISLDELKVVISLKGDKASVGVQAPECDPAFFTVDGDLKAAIKAVPKLVEEAKTRWAQSKLNPKCETPPPAPPPVSTASGASTSRSAKPAAQASPQPHMF